MSISKGYFNGGYYWNMDEFSGKGLEMFSLFAKEVEKHGKVTKIINSWGDSIWDKCGFTQVSDFVDYITRGRAIFKEHGSLANNISAKFFYTVGNAEREMELSYCGTEAPPDAWFKGDPEEAPEIVRNVRQSYERAKTDAGEHDRVDVSVVTEEG